MRRCLSALLLFVALAGPALVALAAGDASANVALESPYTFEQTFGTALRLLRVDLGCTITEKDADNGYVLFDYQSSESGKKVHRGSVEVVRNKQGVHVSVQLTSLPQYHEQMVIDALAKKLASEHGAPPPKAKPAPPPAEDGGTDGGEP